MPEDRRGGLSGLRAGMSPRLTGLSLMPEPDWAAAAWPLFEAGEVDALEWSFDTRWDSVPEWVAPLLDEYAAAGRLTGHGVTFSPFSARFTPRQADWLARLTREVARRRYTRVSEHFGCTTAGDLVDGAPLPVPFREDVLRVGRDRLARLADAAGVPVGLENLALAFSRQDALDQGPFLEELLAPVNGFLVLDLHNLYCQSVNFGVPLVELMERYPLKRARTLHVSGGSTVDGIRRDTHDGAVPDAVIEALPRALAACPHADTVILERLGGTFANDVPGALVAEFRRVRAIVSEHGCTIVDPQSERPSMEGAPVLEDELGKLQQGLLQALEKREAVPADPWLARAEPRMLELAGDLVRKWSRR